MFGIINYNTFVLSSILLNITPGSDIIYVITRSVSGGRKIGAVSAAGICTGILLHTLLASLGLSAILASSSAAFNIMKVLGAAYLIVMGIRTVFQKSSILSTNKDSKKVSLSKTFREGVLTNALNPKVALFFLALLPQFVSPENTFGPLPFMMLGFTFFTTSIIWCLFLALVSSFAFNLLMKNEKVSKIATKATGLIYIILGLGVLLAKK